MILIKHKGETLLVESLDGYPKAKVIATDVPHPPHDHCRWDGKWVEDADAKAQAEQRAKLRRLIRDGRLREALARLKS
jgi:hypothetical protein